MSHIVIFMIFHIVICMYYYRLASGLLRVGGTKQSSAEWLWLPVKVFIPLPQRETEGFHYAPLNCFSQCQ